MNKDIQTYNDSLTLQESDVCELLAKEIDQCLSEAENKIWHGHPVWFLEGNPVVGYSKIKAGISLFFWSVVDFEEEQLKPGSGKFKEASILYTAVDQIITGDLERWLNKSRDIQWDYKNIRKRKGVLERLK